MILYCPSDWTYKHEVEKCYWESYPDDLMLNWESAQSDCEKRSDNRGHLTEPRDEEEAAILLNEFITQTDCTILNNLNMHNSSFI